MKLVLPDTEYEASYSEYIQELGDEERYPFPLDFDHSDFPELIARLDKFRRGDDLPEGFVPATTYWLVDGGEILGVSNQRHNFSLRYKFSFAVGDMQKINRRTPSYDCLYDGGHRRPRKGSGVL